MPEQHGENSLTLFHAYITVSQIGFSLAVGHTLYPHKYQINPGVNTQRYKDNTFKHR